MPKSSNQLALSRQWELLKKLPSRGPGITASDLTDYLRDEMGFAVSKRTVERDLIDLARLFGIRCNDESVPYGWHWLPGKQCDFSSVDLADALSLVLAEQTLEKLLPASMLTALQPRFALARSKLAALGNHRFAKWADKVRYVPTTMSLIPPKVDARVLATVQEALLQERQVLVTYTGPQDKKAGDIPLHPLSLIQRGSTPYLVATAYNYTDLRLYAIHRIKKAVLSKEPVVPPADYNIDRYLASGAMEFGSHAIITLKAWVSNELGIYLSETPLSESQTIKTKQGRHLLTAKVTDSWQLRWWILSQGVAIEVVSPQSLRKEIITTLNNAVAPYRKRQLA